MGFSPFGIDHPVYHTNHPIKEAYAVQNNLMPLILRAQTDDKIDGFIEGDEASQEIFKLGDFVFSPITTSKKTHLLKDMDL